MPLLFSSAVIEVSSSGCRVFAIFIISSLIGMECRRKGPQTSGIVYCLSRDESEAVARYLQVPR